MRMAMLVLCLLLSATTQATAQHNRHKKPKETRNLPPAMPAPAPDAGQSGRVLVQGPLAEIVYSPNVVYVINVRPFLGCVIVLPELCRALNVTHPDIFSAETLPLAKKKPTDTADVPRDRRIIAVKPELLPAAIDGVQIETNLTIFLESGKRIHILLLIDQDESRNIYEVRFRDPEIEAGQNRQREETERRRRQNEEEERQREVDRLTAQNRLQGLINAKSTPFSGVEIKTGEAVVRLQTERAGSFLVAVLTVTRAGGNKPLDVSRTQWGLDGQTIADVEKRQELPTTLVKGECAETVFIPVPAKSNSAKTIHVSFKLGTKPVLITASVNALVQPDVITPSSIEAKHNPVSVVPPVAIEPKPVTPTPAILPPAGSEASAHARLAQLLDVTYDPNNGAAATPIKQALIKLYTEQHGDYLAATLRVERKLGTEPLPVGRLRWSFSGHPVVPVYAANELSSVLEAKALVAGYLFKLPSENGSLTCTLEIQGKDCRVTRTVIPVQPPVDFNQAANPLPQTSNPVQDRITPATPGPTVSPADNRASETQPRFNTPQPTSQPETPVEATKLERKTYRPTQPNPTYPPPGIPQSNPRVQPVRLSRLQAVLQQAVRNAPSKPLLVIKEHGVTIKVLSRFITGTHLILTCEIFNTTQEISNLSAWSIMTKDQMPGFVANTKQPSVAVFAEQSVLGPGDFGRFGFAFEGIRPRPIEIEWIKDGLEYRVKIEP